MIGRLKGILVHKQPPWLVIDVHGVGYELEAPMSTFYDLPEVGREVSLFTHYAQKEDSVSLYGFMRESERRLFRDVQKVSGIGAKIALAVLSGVSVDDFARLVSTSDVTALTRMYARRRIDLASMFAKPGEENNDRTSARHPGLQTTAVAGDRCRRRGLRARSADEHLLRPARCGPRSDPVHPPRAA